MTTVTYQVVCNTDLDLEEELIRLLQETFEDHYVDLDEMEVASYITINYDCDLDNGDSTVAGFELSFDDDGVVEASGIVESLNGKLKDHADVLVAFKFYDQSLFAKLNQLYAELFEIEMRLREAITFIFAQTYQRDFYNLLRDVNVKLQRGLPAEIDKREKTLRDALENEFFHLLFSDYIKLGQPRRLQQDDLFMIATLSNDFDEFKEHILYRGVREEAYLDFIAGIKTIMEPLEKVRNCVAHNRTPTRDELDNYERARNEVRRRVDEFFAALG